MEQEKNEKLILEPENTPNEHDFGLSEAQKYSSATKNDDQGILVTNLDDSKYYLYNPNGIFEDFNLPFEMTKEEYDRIDISKIKVSLFKSAAWQNGIIDKYKWWSSQDLVNSLFEGNESFSHLIKDLLLRLSIRRQWKLKSENVYWEDNKDVIRPSKPKTQIRAFIKYFDDFGSLKKYVDGKVKKCLGKNSCVPVSDELNVLKQDMDYFFDLKIGQSWV